MKISYLKGKIKRFEITIYVDNLRDASINYLATSNMIKQMSCKITLPKVCLSI